MATGARPPNDAAGGSSATRVRLVALAVLLGVGAVLAVGRSWLEVRTEATARDCASSASPTADGLELIVYVAEADNQPDVAGGRSSVRVECADAGGQVLFRGGHRWPFTDTDNGTTDPHIHQRIPASAADAVARYRLPPQILHSPET